MAPQITVRLPQSRPTTLLHHEFKNMVRQWAVKIGARPKQIQIQRMTTKWASCSTKGRLCFSSDLLNKDKKFQESVIVHEIIHLLVPNHGKLFKSLISAFLPHSYELSALSAKCGVERKSTTDFARLTQRGLSQLSMTSNLPYGKGRFKV